MEKLRLVLSHLPFYPSTLLPDVPSITLEFSVRDTGIGVSADQHEHLFEPFAQGEAFISRRFGGTGLGLSIAKNLAELMGGTIRVESQVGTGSTFFFTVQLPLSGEVPANKEQQSLVAAAAEQPLRILLAEDNPANQKLATYILQERGHVVDVVGGGEEAIDLAQRHAYDAILMDVQMPGMNGLEATAAIRRRQSGGRRVPIIAMTAHALKNDRERCLAAGMDAYLSKPVNARELVGTIEGLSKPSVAAGGDPPCGATAADRSGEAIVSPGTAIFNPHEALQRCWDRHDALYDMIQYFLDSLDAIDSELGAAMCRGDYVKAGQLGHQLKGSLAYLAAERATRAAAHVERFCDSPPDEESVAGDAVQSLKQECRALKATLEDYMARAAYSRLRSFSSK